MKRYTQEPKDIRFTPSKENERFLEKVMKANGLKKATAVQHILTCVRQGNAVHTSHADSGA